MSQAQQEAILRGKQETFGEFIWNSERGEFLGRTGTSWMKIFIFYCTYYSFLACFFAICMTCFYQTLRTDGLPQYSPGNEDSILKNPSISYRPRPPADNIESSMITYESGNSKTYTKWTSSMDDLLNGNEDPKRNYQSKVAAENAVECNAETTVPLPEDKVCNFEVTSLGTDCTKANNFGYATDSPCIILKLNRMIGWVPDVYEKLEDLPKDLPTKLDKHIRAETAKNNNTVPKMLWVSCDGENPMDSEMLGPNIKYLPAQGFPFAYFPYTNQDNYKSPLISVQFVNPRRHILINVLCKIWGKGITYDKKGGLGMVHFELLMD